MGKKVQQNQDQSKKSKTLKFDYILKKGEDDEGNIYYKIKWKDLPKEDASFEPIENLSPIQKEIKEYDINYLLNIREIEVSPIRVNFIKKVNKKLYCNVLFEKYNQEKNQGNNSKQPFIANLYIPYKNLKSSYPKLLINYFEQYYKD